MAVQAAVAAEVPGAATATAANVVIVATAMSVVIAANAMNAMSVATAARPPAEKTRRPARADAAVLLQARGLTRGAFLGGLRRAAVTLALAARAGAPLCKGGSCREQARGDDDCECIEFHNSFRLIGLICIPL